MHLGRTSLRVAGLLAAGRGRHALRSDLAAKAQVIGGETTYIVKIPEKNLYLRYPELAWNILSFFDGTRTDREVWEGLRRYDPSFEVDYPAFQDFVAEVDPNLWAKTLAEKNLALLEKIRGERQERASDQNLFYWYFSAWDPDAFFNRVIPYLRWIWTRWFFVFSLCLFLVAGVMLAADFGRIIDDSLRFYNLSIKSPAELLDFWILLFVVTFIHECAHGLTCKNYGGEVRQMGFLLIYLTPAFYTDVSDMYLFDKDHKRQWTLFSGVWSELLLFALSILVWSFTASGTIVNDWAYKFMLMTSVIGVLLNLNPLMKFDGYLIACQLLKIDNLREDAFAYAREWWRHALSGGRHAVQRVSRRNHRIFLAYAPAAFLYGALIIFLVVLRWVHDFGVGAFGELWGWSLTGLAAWAIVRKRLASALRLVREELPKTREDLMDWISRREARWAAVAAALLLLFPFREKVTTEFMLEAARRAELRASVDGLVSAVPVGEEQEVQGGALIAQLRSPEVEARSAIVERRLRLADQALRDSQARGDLTESQRSLRERERLLAEREDLRRKRVGLEIRAPFQGVLTTALIEQRVGDYLVEGEVFCTLADRRIMRARVLVRDVELEDIAPGSTARLQVNAHPLRILSGSVRQVLPAAAADRPVSRPDRAERRGLQLYNYFAVTLEIPNPDRLLLEGMTGTAKLYGPRRALAWRAGRSVWRWTRSQVWS